MELAAITNVLEVVSNTANSVRVTNTTANDITIADGINYELANGTRSALGTVINGQTISPMQTVELQVNSFAPMQRNDFSSGVMNITPLLSSLTITSNTANSVAVTNNGYRTIFIANDTHFRLYDDDDMDDNAPPIPGGKLLDGDEGDDVPFLDRTYLEDSDNPVINHFVPAYIVPKYDVGNNNDFVTFQLNVPQDSSLSLRTLFEFNQVATEANIDFWTIYLLSAYQYTIEEDEDPETDGSTAGRVDRIPDALGVRRGQGAAVFLETVGLKECPPAPLTQPEFCNIPAVKIHEIGHLFGAEHGERGVMDILTTNFSDDSLAAIRRRTYP